jgi:hypothetical protein
MNDEPGRNSAVHFARENDSHKRHEKGMQQPKPDFAFWFQKTQKPFFKKNPPTVRRIRLPLPADCQFVDKEE